MSNKNKNRGFVEEPEETVTEAVEEVSEPVVTTEEKVSEPVKEIDPNPVTAKATSEKPKRSKVKIIVPLNVRTGPSLYEMAVDVVMPDRVVRIYEEKNGWGRIGNERWINLSNDYVERV